VFHKGTALIIESIAQSKQGARLDIIGRGPELARCQQLVKELGLEAKVRFLDWFPTHSDLITALGDYRGLVIPSIEDANGIVVQEAMALGLPVIALDWGGPQLLVHHEQTGYLVRPDSRSSIVQHIASHMDELAMDGDLAEKFSIAGRECADRWSWPILAREWAKAYEEVPRSVRQVG
jgi:glycosyltransferase involved in cell wall biosynthesis